MWGSGVLMTEGGGDVFGGGSEVRSALSRLSYLTLKMHGAAVVVDMERTDPKVVLAVGLGSHSRLLFRIVLVNSL